MAIRSLFTVGISILIAIFPSYGSAQTEYIVMMNGDRISGVISRIWDEELFIEPDYADEFAVDLVDIASIHSDREFEVDLPDGMTVLARPDGLDENGEQILIIEAEVVTFPLMQLAELEEQDEYFDWDSIIDASSVLNQGNTDSTTVRFSGNANLIWGDHRHTGDLTLANESTNDETVKQQTLLVYDYNWLFGDQAFVSGSSSFERDPIRNLEQRVIVSTGLGYDIWDSARRTLRIQGGVGFQSEEIDNMQDENEIAYWNLRFSYDFFSGDVTVFHDHTLRTNLSGRENSVLKTSSGVRLDLANDFYANFEVVYDYETNPASAAEKEDVSIVAGVGIEF